MAQKRVRSEMIQMEDVLAQIRKEYEMLRIEFEQNMAANEQTAPINREMRHLITSLQNHNGQLKGEVNRYKSKYKQVSVDHVKLRKELDEAVAKMSEMQTKVEKDAEVKKEGGDKPIKEESGSSEEGSTVKEKPFSGVKAEGDDGDEELKEGDVKKEPGATPGSGDGTTGAVKQESAADVKKETDAKELQKLKEQKAADCELVRDLKTQLKKAVNDQKEMKLLLDMYKGVSKEQRDKVQLMATEKKLRSELDELRKEMKKVADSKREDRKKLADEDALRKIKQLEDKIYELQKQLATQKPADGSWQVGYRPFVGSHVSFLRI